MLVFPLAVFPSNLPDETESLRTRHGLWDMQEADTREHRAISSSKSHGGWLYFFSATSERSVLCIALVASIT